MRVLVTFDRALGMTDKDTRTYKGCTGWKPVHGEVTATTRTGGSRTQARRFPNRPYDGRLFLVGAVRERPVTVETTLRGGAAGRDARPAAPLPWILKFAPMEGSGEGSDTLQAGIFRHRLT